MKRISPRSAIIAGCGIVVVSGYTLVGPVLALDGTTDGNTTSNSQSTEHKTAAADHTEQTKQKLCLVKSNVISNILRRTAERGNRHLSVISEIATKTENFYTKSGKDLSNYDSLVAAVDSAKTTAQAAVDKVKTDSTSFSCDTADPKASLNTFKTDVKAQQTALQNYHTAVKNLIVGVKSVVGETNSSDKETVQQ